MILADQLIVFWTNSFPELVTLLPILLGWDSLSFSSEGIISILRDRIGEYSRRTKNDITHLCCEDGDFVVCLASQSLGWVRCLHYQKINEICNITKNKNSPVLDRILEKPSTALRFHRSFIHQIPMGERICKLWAFIFQWAPSDSIPFIFWKVDPSHMWSSDKAFHLVVD